MKIRRRDFNCDWEGISLYYNLTSWIALKQGYDVYHIRYDNMEILWKTNKKTRILYNEIRDWVGCR